MHLNPVHSDLANIRKKVDELKELKQPCAYLSFELVETFLKEIESLRNNNLHLKLLLKQHNESKPQTRKKKKVVATGSPRVGVESNEKKST